MILKMQNEAAGKGLILSEKNKITNYSGINYLCYIQLIADCVKV